MLSTYLGHRHRLAVLVGLCLILALSVVPAAVAIPILDVGEESAPALAPSPGGFDTASVARTSSSGVDWGDVVLAAGIGFAVAIAATALIVAARRRRPVPVPHI
jgi:hypothetical protein